MIGAEEDLLYVIGMQQRGKVNISAHLWSIGLNRGRIGVGGKRYISLLNSTS
jgi:hypothetical protein